MDKIPVFNRLFVRITAAFLLAAVLGVVLVAVWAYNSTSGYFSDFISHTEAMDSMMGGGTIRGMMGSDSFIQAQNDFLGNLSRTLWIAGLSGAALAIFLGYVLTRQIVAPLGKVTAAARRVTRGELEQQVDVKGSGELAELGESFNIMSATLTRDRELRQNMVADIAHELRTPLTILQGNVEAMLDGIIKTDTENLSSIHQETLLLARLIEDLRTLSLAESGQLNFHPQQTDIKNLSQQVIDGFQTQLALKNISIMLEAPDNLPDVSVDPGRTSQVLRNLLNNAYQYTAEGGGITVGLTTSEEGITVFVKDTGTGISPDELPSVFDRFYRVDRSRTRSTGGSGLGLAIVKQLVEAQGGTVRAESEKGKGSTFSFSIPASLD